MTFKDFNSSIISLIEQLKTISKQVKMPTHDEVEAQFGRSKGKETWACELAGKSVDDLMRKLGTDNYLPILEGRVRDYYERFYAIVTLVCFLHSISSYRKNGTLTPDYYTSRSLYDYFSNKNLDAKMIDRETYNIYRSIARLSAVFLDSKYQNLHYGSRLPSIDKNLRDDFEIALRG